MDGLLVVDKPSGPTSHDIVARLRRLLQEKRVGHTGTLDPMASGVLPLLIGRATRLARFLSATEKRYEATVRLGLSTDTYDALGQPAGIAYAGPLPDDSAIERALDAFRGTFMQQPPAFSAKKVGGRRSYRLARARSRGRVEGQEIVDALPGTTDPDAGSEPLLPAPATVTTTWLELVSVEHEFVRLRLACSSGFYVRSLAYDLGQALGTGGHLAALRRTATSGVTLTDAISLAELMDEGGRQRADAAHIPLERMLLGLPRVDLTTLGTERVAKGRDLGPAETLGSGAAVAGNGPFRLFGPGGHLLAIGERSSDQGFLHPSVVLM